MNEANLVCWQCGSKENLQRWTTKKRICTNCNTERLRQYRANGGMERQRAAIRKYEAAHPERRKAWNAVQKLTKKPCEICETTERVHAHHDRPEMTLDVIWLCPKHHKQRHAALKSLELVA